MSRFSDLLNQYIKEKSVKLYGLSRLCQIDRTTLYRFTHGRQCPSSSDLVYRLADALRLTPQQKEHLFEAWEITNTGEGLWMQRRAVEHFLLNFPGYASHDQPSFSKDEQLSEVLPISILKSKNELQLFLRSMLTLESVAEQPELMLLLQPEQVPLSDFIPYAFCKGSFKICHIVCLNNHFTSAGQSVSPSRPAKKDENSVQYSSYSVECLEALIPFYINQPDFHSFYYYDNVTAHFDSVSLMPCMILSGSQAVTCSGSLSFGIVHSDQAIVSMLHGIFRKYEAAAHPLAMRITWHTSLFRESIRFFQTRDSVCFSSSPPYIFSWLTPDLLQKYWNAGNAESDNIFSDCSLCLSAWKEASEDTEAVCYATQAGLERFMATGCIPSLPDGILRPLSFHDRLRYLDYLYQIVRTRPVHLVKGSLEQTPGNFILYVNAQYIFLLFPENSLSLAALTIREPGLVQAFSDLFASIGEVSIFSRQETCEYIKKLL